MGKIKHRSREDIKLQQLPGMPRNLFRGGEDGALMAGFIKWKN